MPTEVIMPKVDMDMDAGTIAAWHVQEGEQVEKGAALFDIETDKAAMEVESPASGALHYVSAQPGDIVQIGGRVAWIFAEGEAVEPPENGSQQEPAETSAPKQDSGIPATPNGAPKHLPAAAGEKTHATPLARRMARTSGVDLSSIAGSGPRGRITRKDVEAAAATPVSTAAPTDADRQADASRARLDALGIVYDAVGVDRMRARIAERLTTSKATVPHFYLEADCRLDKLLAFRKEVNEALAASDSGKISINDLLVKASALALCAVPKANASWAGDEILRYRDANVSVAVSVDGGLMTPVVRQAQTKSILAISREIADLAERAKKGKLASHDYQGGSFSISNLGMFGVKAFSAIINPPESMILAVGKANRQFVEADDGSPVAATILSVRLSCDHRVVDGVLGAQWLSEWQRLVENPFLLALGETQGSPDGRA
ncbi:dihydrolipoamide acetyltransferase family protein [Hoeflea prorocentri]|uniref:Dihydrolipoamide acetyltransferase component of pyruvate dehydrogenase complex n=1 Tax=Hoeflea prorocentri TaxID=1922333 RepID=A0A9X3UKL1_9HYPH|nr:dihydrolipoamide acetyltransferase family protein [Hoeflea prorocentri]MCY6383028.1 dihydrolipoamide acetyltransferase family protein [Hoeflea prorocentri]MDA5400828.1 dihydrolipoamide acetyltransferase family protein [Hoeflea prorocentri]